MKRLVAVAATLAVTTATVSAKGPAFVFALDPASRVAPIRITNAFSYGSGMVHRECVSWVNRSEKTITAIRFVFTYIDASGTVRGTDPFDRRGTFAPGSTNEGLSTIGQADRPMENRARYENCRGYTFPREGIAINRIAIERVDFEDGTAWTPSAASPSPAASPLSSSRP